MSLDQAIAYAMKFEAFEGSLDHVRKPQNDSELESSMAPIYMYQSRESRVTLEQVVDLIDKIFEKFRHEIKDLLKKLMLRVKSNRDLKSFMVFAKL